MAESGGDEGTDYHARQNSHQAEEHVRTTGSGRDPSKIDGTGNKAVCVSVSEYV